MFYFLKVVLQIKAAGKSGESAVPEHCYIFGVTYLGYIFSGFSPQIPGRVRAKSYLTGSSGDKRANPRVISMAVRMFAAFRVVSPNSRETRCIWTSNGTISFAGEIASHPPGSTASFLTIHRRKRFIRLHALPREARGSRWPGFAGA